MVPNQGTFDVSDTVFTFTAGSLGDILATAGLAAEVVKVLYDNRNIAKECEDLAIELRSLQSVLILTEYALQRYGSTPLGEPLSHFIRPEVAQCHLSIAQFSENINACQLALSTTTISSLWRRVVWAASDEAASLSAKLSNHRLKLATLLISLNSARLMDIESIHFTKTPGHLYTSVGNLASVRRIKDNTIEVVDPLGDTMPVSILFCTTWEAFHYVVKGYSRNRIGQSYIEQGDYQIIRPDTGQVIRPSEFSKTVKEGETVEMSIIMRSQQSIEAEEGRCPRCSCFNWPDPSDGGWIRCLSCSGRFQTNTVRAEDISGRRTIQGKPVRGHKSRYNTSQKDQLHKSSEGDETHDRNKEKTKLTRSRRTKNTRKRSAFDDEPPTRNFSDAKFFRRISLEVHSDEYDREVIHYMQSMERLTMPSPELMDQNTEINWDMRPGLMEFLIETHQSLRLRPETLYLTVNILDRYVARRISLKKDPIFLACTMLWIGAKKEEVNPPPLHDIGSAYDQKYETADFVQMELHILNSIEWSLEHPTAFLWFSMLTRDSWNGADVKYVGWFLMELTLYDREFIRYRPSSIASGSLTLARLILDQSYQPRSRKDEAFEVAETLDGYLAKHFDDLPANLTKKYSHAFYSNASDLIIRQYSRECQPFIRRDMSP